MEAVLQRVMQMLLQASDHRDDVECAEIVEQLLEDVCAEIEDEVRSRHDITDAICSYACGIEDEEIEN